MKTTISLVTIALLLAPRSLLMSQDKVALEFTKDPKLGGSVLQLNDLEYLTLLSSALEKRRPEIILFVQRKGFVLSDRSVSDANEGKLRTEIEFLDTKNSSVLSIKQLDRMGSINFITSQSSYKKKFEKSIREQCTWDKSKDIFVCKNILVRLTSFDTLKSKWHNFYFIKGIIELTLAESHHERGLAKAKEENYLGAISDYTKAIELDGSFEEAYFSRAIAYSALEDYLSAEDDYTKVIQLNPKNEQAYYRRGMIAAMDESHRLAIEDLSKAIELDPQYKDAYYFRGTCRLETADYIGAKEDMNKVIELSPAFGRAYVHRAKAKLKLNDTSGACADFKRAVELKVENADSYINKHCK